MNNPLKNRSFLRASRYVLGWGLVFLPFVGTFALMASAQGLAHAASFFCIAAIVVACIVGGIVLLVD
jgi:hypothetical protein